MRTTVFEYRLLRSCIHALDEVSETELHSNFLALWPPPKNPKSTATPTKFPVLLVAHVWQSRGQRPIAVPWLTPPSTTFIETFEQL